MSYSGKILFLFLSLILLVSCKFGKGKSTEFPLLNKVTNSVENKAASVIHYNNGLVELTDAQLEYITYLNRNLKFIKEGLKTPNQTILLTKITDVFYFNLIEIGNVNDELSSDAFSQEEVAFFKENTFLMNQSFEDLRMLYQNLEQYVIAQEYKKDKAEEGCKMVQKIEELTDNYYNYSDLVMLKIFDLSEKAEVEIMKTHPLRSYISEMKEVSDVVSEFVDMAFEESDSYHKNEKKMNNLLIDSERIMVILGERDLTQLNDYPGKEKFYNSYISALNDFMITANRVVKESQKSGKINEGNINDLLMSEEFMREFYNEFVD